MTNNLEPSVKHNLYYAHLQDNAMLSEPLRVCRHVQIQKRFPTWIWSDWAAATVKYLSSMTWQVERFIKQGEKIPPHW